MAYDSARGVTVLFGAFKRETWEWDGANWTQRSPEHKPTNRERHAMAYDSARGVTVMFGGFVEDDYSGYNYDDTWEYSQTSVPDLKIFLPLVRR